MNRWLFAVLISVGLIILAGQADAQRKARLGKVCGDPGAPCKNRDNFQPYELPFDTGRNMVIAESEPFYAIIVKSTKLKPADNCDTLISERERLDTQALFPRNKVFALKCFEPGLNYYTNVADEVTFIAVFAGRTAAEARRFLKTVKNTGKFSGVGLRKMQAGINGT